MSENDGADRSESPETDDWGAPVTQLRDHVVPVSPQFRARVHRSIERRILAANATQFGMLAPITALLELLRAIFEGLGLMDDTLDESGRATSADPGPASSEKDR